MSDRSQDEFAADEMTVDRRGLLVKGGLAAAGATFLASPAAAMPPLTSRPRRES